MTAPFRPLADLLLTRDVLAAGGDPRILRSAHRRGELVRLRRGAYCAQARWSGFTDRERHLARAHAVVQQARMPIVLAGPSAAAAWGMPIAGRFPDEIVVLDRYRGGGRSEPGVRRVTAGAETAEVASVGGLPVTSLARTALDLAKDVPFEMAIGSIDWVLWRKNALAIRRRRLPPNSRGMRRGSVVRGSLASSGSRRIARTRSASPGPER